MSYIQVNTAFNQFSHANVLNLDEVWVNIWPSQSGKTVT